MPRGCGAAARELPTPGGRFVRVESRRRDTLRRRRYRRPARPGIVVNARVPGFPRFAEFPARRRADDAGLPLTVHRIPGGGYARARSKTATRDADRELDRRPARPDPCTGPPNTRIEARAKPIAGPHPWTATARTLTRVRPRLRRGEPPSRKRRHRETEHSGNPRNVAPRNPGTPGMSRPGIRGSRNPTAVGSATRINDAAPIPESTTGTNGPDHVRLPRVVAGASAPAG